MNRIHALIKTVSPLHIAAPSSSRFDVATGNIMFGSAETGGMPCTGIQKMPILGLDDDGKGHSQLYPVIAANNIAGRLRRHAARLVLDAISAKGQKVSLSTYSTLMCGAWTGKPDGEDMRYGEYVEAKKHVYLGLFGGGPRMMRKGFRTHNALPSVAPLRDLLGALAHPQSPGMSATPPQRMTKAWGFRRNDDLRDLVGLSEAVDAVENFEAEFSKRQELIIQEQSEKSDSRTSTKTYSAIEFVVPGVVFDAAFDLMDGLTDAQIGLFLMSLDSLARSERMGGYVRNGFGVIDFANVMFVDEMGEERAIFNNGRLNLEEPLVARYVSAWQAAASDLDAERLEALFRPSGKAERDKAKKAAKGSATAAPTE